MRKADAEPTFVKRFSPWLLFLLPFTLWALSGLNTIARTEQRLDALETGLHSATGIREAPPSQSAFIVGRIDPQTPTESSDEGLALYRVCEFKVDNRCHEIAKHQPTFTVIDADGPVRILNEDYVLLEGAATVRIDHAGSSISMAGFRPGDTVLILGTTANGGLVAWEVLKKTPEAYASDLAGQRLGSIRLLTISIVCILLVCIGVVVAHIRAGPRRRSLLVG
jgi:hypothetical protein